MEQEIYYCQSPDGTTLAYAVSGTGPPIIRTGMWFTHLEAEIESESMCARWEPLASRFTLIRYDMRGTGLSQRDIDSYSETQLVQDHLAVLDALGIDSATIFGISQGAIVAWLIAESAPERVAKIITLGGYDVGVLHRPPPAGGVQAVETFVSLIQTGWGSDDPSFRNLFSTQFLPSATKKELDWFTEYQRKCSSPEVTALNYRFFAEVDLRERVKKIQHDHLLLHASRDRRVDITIGRDLCARLPKARLVTIDSEDHVPTNTPEERKAFFSAISKFMNVDIVDSIPGENSFTSKIDNTLDKVESNRWFKLAVIVGVGITLISALLLFL